MEEISKLNVEGGPRDKGDELGDRGGGHEDKKGGPRDEVKSEMTADDVHFEYLESLKDEATQGVDRAQLDLAKHYLKLADVESASEPNAKLAVDWLLKASRQGNEGATELLRDCLQKQIGKQNSNYYFPFEGIVILLQHSLHLFNFIGEPLKLKCWLRLQPSIEQLVVSVAILVKF